MELADLKLDNRQERYLATMRKIREKNFSKNIPFMILSPDLPEGQVYREYPDGKIEVQEVSAKGTVFLRKTIRVLGQKQADCVRKVYGL